MNIIHQYNQVFVFEDTKDTLAEKNGTLKLILQFKEQGADAWLNTASVLRSTNCKKNNLRPSTAYLFRVRLRLPGSEWSEWSAPSDAISTLDASPQRTGRIVHIATPCGTALLLVIRRICALPS